MATPTLVTVIGDLAPVLLAKVVYFKIRVPVRYASGPDVLVPHTFSEEVAPDGTFSANLYGTNDPDWSPSNWTYEVTIEGDNLKVQFDTLVPYDAGTMNFSDLLPAQSASLGTLYAAYSHGNHILVLPTGDPVPPGTPDNTVIVRI